MSTALKLVDHDDLEAVQEQFHPGVMSLGWGPTTTQLAIEAYPLDEVDEDAWRPMSLTSGQPMDTGRHTCILPEA